MKPKQVIVWIVFLVVAVGAYYLSEVVEERRAQEEDQAGRVVSLTDPLEVNRIEIGGRDTPRLVVLERREKEPRWVMTQPVEWPADTLAVDRLINGILEARIKKRIDQPQDLAPFGLDPVSIEVTLFDAKGGRHPFLAGQLSPTSEFLYAAAPDKKGVWLLEPTVRGAVNRTLLELRDKSLLKFTVADVKGLELSWGGGDISLTREAGGTNPVWRFPDGAKADPEEVEDLLYQIHGLETREFLDTGLDLAKMGLEHPAGRLTLFLEDGGKIGLLKGGPVEGGRETYLRRISGGPVMVAENARLAPLAKAGPQALLERRIMDLDRDRVVSLLVENASGRTLYRRQEGRWSRVEPPAREEKDSDPASLILWDLANLKWEKELGKEGYGLDKPLAKVSLELSSEGQGGVAEPGPVLEIGPPDEASGLYPVRVAGGETIFGVDKDSLSGVLPFEGDSGEQN